MDGRTGWTPGTEQAGGDPPFGKVSGPVGGVLPTQNLLRECEHLRMLTALQILAGAVTQPGRDSLHMDSMGPACPAGLPVGIWLVPASGMCESGTMDTLKNSVKVDDFDGQATQAVFCKSRPTRPGPTDRRKASPQRATM